MVSILPFLQWMSHAGPDAPKHRGWAHPVATCIVHYMILIPIAFYAHDYLVEWHYSSGKEEERCVAVDNNIQDRRQTIAIYLVLYSLWTLAWRLWSTTDPIFKVCVVYEYTWLCNATINLGALALWFNRPMLATACCIAVGIDQLMWYVDLAVYFATGKFPIGVSKYVFWPGTSWFSRATCTHHLWTIPVLMNAAEGMHALSLPLSTVLMSLSVVLSRWMTPSKVGADKYLNVNLSHELWKDIKFWFLQINYGDPPVAVYVFRLLWKWQILNCLVFVGLYIIAKGIYGDAPLC